MGVVPACIFLCFHLCLSLFFSTCNFVALVFLFFVFILLQNAKKNQINRARVREIRTRTGETVCREPRRPPPSSNSKNGIIKKKKKKVYRDKKKI